MKKKVSSNKLDIKIKLTESPHILFNTFMKVNFLPYNFSNWSNWVLRQLLEIVKFFSFTFGAKLEIMK